MNNLYKYVNNLVMYSALRNNTILSRIAEVLSEQGGGTSESVPRSKVYDEVHALLEVATKYGFRDNLWKSYIAFLIATDENPFSKLCEMVGASEGTSANIIVKKDMENIYHIFNYDFSDAEKLIGTDLFSIISDYKAMHKDANTYNISVSEKVYELMKRLENATDGDHFFDMVTGFYKEYGVGKFGLNKAFRINDEVEVKNDGIQIISESNICKSIDDNDFIIPITHTSDVTLDNLIGYEMQKEALIENTEAFVSGRPANNCLLYGDAGTGKSTCIKAILNMYYDRGLRLVEIYKHQFKSLSKVLSEVKNRNYKFIIYMDDLSFEEFETDYKYLKAVIEGGLEVRPDNVLIYATSNRRHLIRETWGDRSDMSDDELHHSDTMQEKLSLVARFGVSINFNKPQKKLFDEIVVGLARQAGLDMSDEELIAGANVWSLRNGGYSGRNARYYITHLQSVGSE